MAPEKQTDITEAANRLLQENLRLRSALEATDSGRAVLRQQEEFSRLLAVSQRIVSELDLDRVFDMVAENAREIVQADLVVVPMLSKDRDHYTYVAASGTDADDVRGTTFSAHVGMCGWVLKHERSLLFGETSTQWNGVKTDWEAGQQSAVLVPLVGREGILGGLSALGKHGGGPFTHHDLDLLTMFANQVSIAIENAMLFQQLNRKEGALKKERDFTSAVLDTVGAMVLVLDRDGTIIRFNHTCEQVSGYALEEVRGRHVWDFLIPPEQVEEVKNVFRNLTAGMFPNNYDNYWVAKDGTKRLISWSNTCLLGSDGSIEYVIPTGIDITEHKRLEAQLLQSQKMESVGQLAGGVAHDFNNILSAIMGYGSIIRMKLPADSPLLGNMDHLLESARRAADLTRSLLTFSKQQVLDMKPVRPNDIISRLDKFLHRIIGEDVELKPILRNDAVILADSGRIEQVLMNLAANARDAMPGGGYLTIETDVVNVAEAEAKLHGVDVPGTYVVISVTDSGVGMNEETKKRIFEPFFTTKETGRGTGLGLSIVYGIVKQHHGYINVYSNPGTGTSFKIYFPAHGGPAAESEASAAPVAMVGGTETILLAEDDLTLRTFFTDVLSDLGYTVIATKDGAEAIEQFSRHQDDIRLCLLDMIMPRKGGKETYEEIKRRRPDIKVIFSSGYTADKFQREGVPAGCEFIQKPVEPQILMNKIREVLDRK